MAHYAMISEGSIIEVLYNQEEIPVWPNTSTGHTVIAVECDSNVTRDWCYTSETGEFYNPEDVVTEEVQSKIQYDPQIAMMESQAIIYEEILSLKSMLGGIE